MVGGRGGEGGESHKLLGVAKKERTRPPTPPSEIGDTSIVGSLEVETLGQKDACFQSF